MITNGAEKPVSDRLSQARKDLSSAAPGLDAIARGEEPFVLRLESPGVEFQALAPIGPNANRTVPLRTDLETAPWTEESRDMSSTIR